MFSNTSERYFSDRKTEEHTNRYLQNHEKKRPAIKDWSFCYFLGCMT